VTLQRPKIQNHMLGEERHNDWPTVIWKHHEAKPSMHAACQTAQGGHSHDTTHAMPDERSTTAFLFLYFLKTFFYRNMFSVSHFTVL
jgi:hypothetical protein